MWHIPQLLFSTVQGDLLLAKEYIFAKWMFYEILFFILLPFLIRQS